jgi:hypothetical protein
MRRLAILGLLAALALPAAADDTATAVSQLSAALSARVAEIDALPSPTAIELKESSNLSKAGEALAGFKGTNDKAGLASLAKAASAIVKSGTSVGVINAGLRSVADCCITVATTGQSFAEASKDALSDPKNEAKIDKKLDKAAALLQSSKESLDAEIATAFKEFTKAIIGFEIADALADKLKEKEDAGAAPPPGMTFTPSPSPGNLPGYYVRSTVPGTTYNDRFIFKSLVFVGRTEVDGVTQKELNLNARDNEMVSGFENLRVYGLDNTYSYPLTQMLQTEYVQLVLMGGTPGTRRIVGTFTYRVQLPHSRGGGQRTVRVPLDATF